MANKKAPANEGSLPGLAKKDTYIIHNLRRLGNGKRSSGYSAGRIQSTLLYGGTCERTAGLGEKKPVYQHR